MPDRWSRFVPLVLAFLLAAAGRGEPAAPAGASSGVPRGVTPLAPEKARHFDELLHAAEQYRGLKAKRQVAAGSLDSRALKEEMKASMGKDYASQDLKVVETGLKAFGLIPESMDLRSYLPDLMSSQVAGYYDPNRKYLALVRPSGESADDDEGERKAEKDMVLIHELTHALQDQSFDLHRFEDHEAMSDASTALEALVEGDATLTELDYDFRMGLERLPGLEAVLASMMQDPKKMIEDTPDLPGAKEMMAAPAWLRDTLLFSYLQGAAFCLEVREQGGQNLLDYAFRSDPPRSTEQILHPEKWYARRDNPVIVHLPDLTGALSGYRRTAEGQMGELSTRIFLRERLQDYEQAAVAAAGWGGDRFAVYEGGGGRLLVWVTEWDTEPDARQFRDALAALGDWQVEMPTQNRVVAVRGSLGGDRWARLRSRLAAVTIDRPVNKKVDLVALGAAAVEPDDEAAGKLLRRIQVKQEVNKVLPKGAPRGEISQDGRSYTNQTLGISIRLPDSLPDWRLASDPSNPQILTMISSPNGVHIGLGYQALPPDATAVSISRMVEQGFSSTLTGFRKLEELEHSQGDLRIRDVSFVAFLSGKQVMGSLRTMARGADLFFFTVMGPAESWVRDERLTLRIMNSFKLGMKKVP